MGWRHGTIPVVEPIHHFGHFFNEERTIHVHGVSGEDGSLLPRDPLLDVTEHFLRNEILRVRGLDACFREAALREEVYYRDYGHIVPVDEPRRVYFDTNHPYYTPNKNAKGM